MHLRLLFLFFITFVKAYSQNTLVNGLVLDAKSKDPIPYVTVQFSFGSIGTATDNYGRFLLESKSAMTEVKISSMGYQTQTIKIKANQQNEVKVLLKEMDAELREITIRPEKYKRKNPAVDLIHEVFLHKDQNRKEGLDYYEFDTHERLRLDVNGVTEKFKKRWYFRPFRFAFDYCDTNQVNQKVKLPFFLRERILTSYYRRNPAVKKERLRAERQTAFEDDYDVDKDGISAYINNMYSDVDIYEPTIMLFNKEFVGPLSATATTFYRFYITDTVNVDNQRFASIFFSPINKSDLAFMGNMLVTLDSTYAVKSVDMGISKDINLNWVKNIQIKQNFDFQGEGKARRLLLSNDLVVFDMKIWKNKEGRSMLATKTNSYKNYIINQPQLDSLYKGKIQLLRDTGKLEKTPEYWANNRHEELTTTETNIKTMIDTVKRTQTFKILNAVGSIMNTGYQRIGKVEVGALSSLLRYNGVEGTRIQLNLRTSDRYFKHFRLRTYGAYGTLDKAWKYGISSTIGFKGARPGRYPVNQLRASYEHDLYFPGLNSNAGQGLASSFQRIGTNRLLLNKIEKIDYSREYKNGIGYNLYALRKEVSESGVANTEPQNNNIAITTELGGWFRYAPNEKFYQGTTDRTTLQTRFPIFFFQYKAGIKGLLGGEYAYQRASLRVAKNFYLAPFGKGQCIFEVGKVFGQVSYPFLEIHRANQSYIFDNEGFNLMNYLEFVSDSYTMLHYNHDFGGILLNRIPLIKKYRLREGVTFKALYGGLSAQNIPTANNGLLAFPLNANQQPLTQALGKLPYMEASAGIGNIFGVLRIEYIWRLTYKELPNAQPWGIKAMFSVDF